MPTGRGGAGDPSLSHGYEAPMRRIAAASIVLGLAALVACRSASRLLGPDAPQGVAGQVLLGPMCPVQQADDSCPDQPYQAWIDVLDQAGGTVTRVQSGTDGGFRVGLAPGSYVLHPESGNPLPRAADQDVEVVSGRYTTVTVSFDTGIR